MSRKTVRTESMQLHKKKDGFYYSRMVDELTEAFNLKTRQHQLLLDFELLSFICSFF